MARFLLLFLLAVATGKPVKKWQVLGPFVVGKNELDGEPWLTSNATELLPGVAKATPFAVDESGLVQVSWPVDWQSLVSGVGGHELLEWQALAIGTFQLQKTSEIHISCSGIPAFTLDGVSPLVGDLYHAGFPSSSVKLEAGKHRLKIRLRGKVQARFGCNIEQANAYPLDVIPGDSFTAVPDLVDSDETRLAGKYVALPVVSRVVRTDLEDSGLISSLQPVLLSQMPKKSDVSFALPKQALHLSLAPGQAARLPVRLAISGSGACKGVSEHVLELAIRGKLRGEQIQSPSFRVRLKCRKPTQSIVFTFQDQDGSIQHAALVLPQSDSGEPCAGKPCPVMVSLSGTSIPARDSADSYKVKLSKDKDYRFGVSGFWLLAPTRHGAHNWEGPGHITALSALRSLPEIAAVLQVAAPDINQVLIGGHSMGGHGSWLLAAALRDTAMGLASSASWLRKDQYADSNKVLLHDLAAAHVDPALARLLQQAEAEFQVDQLAPTLCDGLAIMIRVGSKDQTVHPWFSRRMFRTLLSAGASPEDVSLVEVPGKEHWWWDTKVSNDGGAVNDEQMRSFYQTCHDREVGAASLQPKWSLVVLNPVTSGCKGGLCILQQFHSHRRSEVSVDTAETDGKFSVRVRTSNVRRLQWHLDDLQKLTCRGKCSDFPQSLTIWLDGQPQTIDDGSRIIGWCRDSEDRHIRPELRPWAPCPSQSRTMQRERSLHQLGPMRQLFSWPVCAIAQSSVEASALLYVANMLVMTGHGGLRILSEAEALGRGGEFSPPEGCVNLLVIGAEPSSKAVAALLHGVEGYVSPIHRGVDASGPWVGLGGCRWHGSSIAATALLPWWTPTGRARLALVATGGSPQAVADAVVMLTTPTIPPMARQPLTHLLPDYVVLDVDKTRKFGAGGFLAAGFWDYKWQYAPSNAWERSCEIEPVAASGQQLRVEL
eukprot:TRINITY_DN65337_c0_g1_i1.p1 TRINITY_DN65337_c0_g1~~TRINITY_DN65337_c0_g1_i1.p1  ORF type:complete len:939 (+),score=30.74 TRINITY_DN65337_c0_g1_i1:59-2875(+)